MQTSVPTNSPNNQTEHTPGLYCCDQCGAEAEAAMTSGYRVGRTSARLDAPGPKSTVILAVANDDGSVGVPVQRGSERMTPADARALAASLLQAASEVETASVTADMAKLRATVEGFAR